MNNQQTMKLMLLVLMLSLTFQPYQTSAKSKKSKLFNTYQKTETEVIEKMMKFEQNNNNNHLTIFNVYGSVDVEGHDGDAILIKATNQVFANSQNLLDEGIEEIGLKFEQYGEKIYVYLDSPYTYFDREEELIWHSDTCWRHHDCSRKHKKKAYKYHMDITVKVPENTNLKVSTINDGDIKISAVDARTLNVNNINGAIDMVDVAGQTDVNAINKDINISYRKNPTSDSIFGSINGDLNIKFAGQPDANVVYETMHGELYSAFDVSMLKPEVKRTSKQKEHGIQYKLGAGSRLKVGNGGPEYKFHTLNGDIKIQRQ